MGDKTLKTAGKESLWNYAGNVFGEKAGKFGGEMFDMGGASSKFFGATIGEYNGRILSTAGAKASE